MRSRRKASFCSICAMCTALFAVCSWICIPSTPPFTFQSLAVFAVTGILGTGVAFTSYALYLFIGIIGIPVFSGFAGGASVLVGPKGGYLVGFAAAVLVSGALLKFLGRKASAIVVSFTAGHLILYLFGSLFYCTLWLGEVTISSFVSALTVTVLPFVPTDIVKLCLAVLITKGLEGRIRI